MIGAAVGSARAALLGALIDDAGLFPPAKLPMSEALAVDREMRTSGDAAFIGAFVVPVSRLGEISASDAPPRISVIIDTAIPEAIATMEAFTLAPIVSIEAVRKNDNDIEIEPLAHYAMSAARTLYLEIPLAGRAADEIAFNIDQVVMLRNDFDGRIAVKLRCGGINAQSHPPIAAVAAAIDRCAIRKIAFKATAGLHHPIHHMVPETGFTMHGFLNLLAAAAVAYTSDADSNQLREIIAEEDPAMFTLDDDAFMFGEHRFDAAAILDIRERGFRSYGSCDMKEPLADLRALGLL